MAQASPQPPHPLLPISTYILHFKVLKQVARRAGYRILSNGAGHINLLSIVREVLALLGALLGNDNGDLLEARRALEAGDHVQQNLLLVEGELALQDDRRVLPGLQALLELHHEWHGFLHLAHLADLAVELLLVCDGVGGGVPVLAQQVDVLLLPGGELLGCEYTMGNIC